MVLVMDNDIYGYKTPTIPNFWGREWVNLKPNF